MFVPFIKGLGVTLKHFLKKPITMKYPEEKWTPYPRFRGLHKIEKDENGKEKCVACCLCAAVCPANAIHIEVREEEGGERYPEVFEIDVLRCIFCGYCVEACPKEALVLTGEYELATYTKEENIYSKERLLSVK